MICCNIFECLLLIALPTLIGANLICNVLHFLNVCALCKVHSVSTTFLQIRDKSVIF